MRAIAFMLIALLLGLAAGPSARAADTGPTTRSYAVSMLGQPKLPADFPYFPYVNPNAPKGGEISIWAQGTFDTLNPYTREGRGGALATIGYETLLTGTADEVGRNAFHLPPMHLSCAEELRDGPGADPAWRLVVDGPRRLELSLADLQAMPQHT